MIKQYWKEFCKNTGRGDAAYAGILCFGTDVHAASNALEKIREGVKRVAIYPACGYRYAMSGDAKVGDLNIVTDWQGNPCEVIETVSVEKRRISELTDEICSLDGDFQSHAQWIEARKPILKMEMEELGQEFDEDVEVIVEIFRRAGLLQE